MSSEKPAIQKNTSVNFKIPNYEIERLLPKILYHYTGHSVGHSVYGQGGSPAYKDGLTIKLDSTGKKYVRFLLWADFRARYSNLNPGTAVNGVAKNNMLDFSVRQFRFALYSQLSPRYLILATMGIDNQSFSSGGAAGGGNTGNGGATFNGTLGKKPAFYVHELWNEYTIIPDNDFKTHRRNFASLYIGTGLHYWVGISRMSFTKFI